jgi:hypothetical protein
LEGELAIVWLNELSIPTAVTLPSPYQDGEAERVNDFEPIIFSV